MINIDAQVAQACRASAMFLSELEAATAYIIGEHNPWDSDGNKFAIEAARVDA